MTKTYKVTYRTFAMEIAEVTTYHNVSCQGSLLDWIWNTINVKGYIMAVEVVSDNGSYTQAVNELLKQRYDHPELWEFE